MLDITAANTAALPTIAKPAPAKGYRLRADAEAAAVHDIGPHARRGFEFEAFKCDGKWHWRATDTVKPPTAADIKANGGKRYIAQIVPQPEEKPVEVKPEDLDIPPFLKRESTPEEKDAVRKKLAKTVGPNRTIKNPPDAKAAAKRAERAKAKEAKFEGSPAHAQKKAKEKAAAKVGGNGTAKAKRTSKAPTKAAGQSKTALIGELLTRKTGCTSADVLALTGWPAVSMPQQAKACGLVLRKEKSPGEPTRYFGSKG